MAHKELKFNEEARRSLERGVNILADAVKVKRPKGRYVGRQVRRADDHHDGVPMPVRSRSKTSSRTRARSLSARSRPRPTTWRATAPRRDRAGTGDRLRGPEERGRGCEPHGPQARHRARRDQVVESLRSQSKEISDKEDIARVATISPSARSATYRGRDRQGRQGRRRERRGGPDLRPRARVHRGHAVRQGYLSLYMITTPSGWRRSSRPVHPGREPEDRRGQGPPARARAGHPGRPCAASSRTSRARRSRR